MIWGLFRQQFSEEIARISCSGKIIPPDGHWIRKFIVRTTDADRMAWVTRIHQELHNLREPRRKELRIRWIRPYWESRIECTPVALSNAESARMMSWMDRSKCVLPEFIELMCKSPVPSTDRSHVYYTLRRYADAHPKAVAQALCHLLPKATLRTFGRGGLHAKEMYELLKQHDELSGELAFIENHSFASHGTNIVSVAFVYDCSYVQWSSFFVRKEGVICKHVELLFNK